MKNNLPALWLGIAMTAAVPSVAMAQSPATISFPQAGSSGSASVIPIPT